MIARVFPRRTKATPTDDLAFTRGPMLDDFARGITRVEVSVAFTYDMPRAERLARAWEGVAPVLIGGPATGQPGGEFIPGRYIKPGYIITSRGCPNRCWFCKVWKRERGLVKELPIYDGYNVQDDNLLACSESHIRAVFAMLKRQNQPIEFTGGLEAARLADWHVELLCDLRLKQLFLAYDTPDDYEPLVLAADKFKRAGMIRPESHQVRAFVLIGYPKDTMTSAEARLRQAVKLGIMPLAMLWRDDETGQVDRAWRRFQRTWANAVILGARMREAAKQGGEDGQ